MTILAAADRQCLEGSALFRQINLEPLKQFFGGASVRILEAGATLFEPEVQHHMLYIVLEGEVRVYLSGSEAPAHAVLGPGECVGELSLIDGQGASALVLAARHTRVWGIGHDQIWELVEASHGVARNLLAILSGRVRSNNLTLVSAQGPSLAFEQAASVDALTGLHNRQWVSTAFPRLLERCQRDDMPACLLLFDIDSLSSLNDRFGHLLGDHALRFVAARLAEALRTQDLIARSSAEKFMLLLPRTEVSEGLMIAARLQQLVADGSLATADGPQKITVSCGMAAQARGESFHDLERRAEMALQRANDKGQNCIELATLE